MHLQARQKAVIDVGNAMWRYQLLHAREKARTRHSQLMAGNGNLMHCSVDRNSQHAGMLKARLWPHEPKLQADSTD